MSEATAERRQVPRLEHVDEHGIVSAQVRPGRPVHVLNASAAGALVESGHRLLPGAVVDVQLERPVGRTAVRGRVVRSYIAALGSAYVRYRAGIVFDPHLPWLSDMDRDGYRVPTEDSRDARRPRAVPSQPVV